MLHWETRIDGLCDLLNREYAISDRPAVEILLSGLIPAARTPAPWLVLETNWFDRDCLRGWFSFGELWNPVSLARLRARSPWREVELETREFLESPSDERLFVEPDYERFPRFHRLTQAQYLLQRSLRVRTRSMRAANPLRGLDKYDQDRRTDELAAATRHVVEDPIGDRPEKVTFIEPSHFLYHVELVQRLSPWYADWDQLVRAFGLLGVRHAYLHGRPQTDEQDYGVLARVAQDSVPPWIATAVKMLLEGPSQTPTLAKHMCLEEMTRRSGHGAHRELVRLRRAGIIEWKNLKQHWVLAEAHRAALRAVISGQAFATSN